MLIKGSETCNAHKLRIMGEMKGSTDADDSLPRPGKTKHGTNQIHYGLKMNLQHALRT